MFLYCLLTATLTSVLLATAAKEEHREKAHPSVTVLNGTYYGLHNTHYNQDFFLGIPFAQQPVGDLRFQIPRQLNTSWSVPRNATEYSPACVGYKQTQGASEACLTLNVVRPADFARYDNLPVAGQ